MTLPSREYQGDLRSQGGRSNVLEDVRTLRHNLWMAWYCNELEGLYLVIQLWQDTSQTQVDMNIGTPATNNTSPLRGPISRGTASTTTEIWTGHPYTNSNLSKIPSTDMPYCCKCEDHNQTPEHLLLYCPNAILKAQRMIFKQAICHGPRLKYPHY